MKLLVNFFNILTALVAITCSSLTYADNQTPDVSPIFPGTALPFSVRIELDNFSLPNGLQSFVVGLHEGKWLLLTGRTNGLHGFNNDPNNFPPSQQNRVVYVIDPIHNLAYFRALDDPQSGLSLDQIESLSTTNTQFYQSNETLYVVGGYGFRTQVNNFATFNTLAAIDIPGLMRWVMGETKKTAAHFIRQTFNELFRVTGGEMFQLGKDLPTLLVFGQDFEGAYFFGNSTQIYTRQIRRFHIHDDGKHLSVEFETPELQVPDPSFRRRDLNIVPILSNPHGKLVPSLVVYSGVFTLSTGVWTVPVTVSADGIPNMADPNSPFAFKQGMNNYACANVNLFSEKTGNMYTVFCGGISYGFFENGVFQTSPNIPFINQVTTIQRDPNGNFTQYLMNTQFPVILSTQSNPGNQLLFGAEAKFIPAKSTLTYDTKFVKTDIIQLDKLKKSTLIGHIVGGIQSTLADTTQASDSAASSYIFRVILDPI